MAVRAHPAALDPDRLLAEVTEERIKGSGPGGQRRNKVQTGVRLTHAPSGLVASATERRALEDNRRVALLRLRARLALEWRETPGPAPSPLWRRRTAGGRLAVGQQNADVPALVAEALDRLAVLDDDVSAAAAALEVSVTRLINVLKLVPDALTRLNRRLEASGRNTYR